MEICIWPVRPVGDTRQPCNRSFAPVRVLSVTSNGEAVKSVESLKVVALTFKGAVIV